MGRLLELPKPDFLDPLQKLLYSSWARLVPNFTLYFGSERFYPNPGLSASTTIT